MYQTFKKKKKTKKVKNSKFYCLAMNMKPVPTIFKPKKAINQSSEIENVISPINIPRGSLGKRLYQQDQCELFISKD